MFTPTEVAFAAGLFEGEGHCARHRSNHSNRLCLNVTSTDVEPLERFRDAFGLGKVYGPYGLDRTNRKPHYRFQVTRHEQVQAIAAAMWPWLSPRRRSQLAKALDPMLLRRKADDL